jgi:hypothetical protein
LNPTKPLTFIISNPNKIIQTLINTIKPQLQTSKLRYSQTQIKPKSDLKSTLSNPKSFKRQTEIENPNLKIQIRSRQINTFKPQIFQTSNLYEKPSGERDPWLHEDRSGRGGAENSRGESRAEQSNREERENFRKNEENWVFGYTDSGTWNSKPGIADLSFSGGVKQ